MINNPIKTMTDFVLRFFNVPPSATLGSDHYWRDWSIQNPDGSYSYFGIDFATAYANGSRFVFLKACSGWSDTRFYPEAIHDARAAGLFAAPYVWLYQDNATQQADFWYSRLKDEPIIWIDFESYEDSVPEAHDLYEAIERLRALGYAGMIGVYTGHYYWLAHGNDEPYWKQFPVCLARYLSGGEPPQVTPPWTDHAPINCDFWQDSALGAPAFYGVENGKLAVDEQKFYGTQVKLEALFGGELPPVDPPPGDETMILTSLSDGLRIRTGAGVSFPQVTVAPTYLDAGQTAEVLSLSGANPEQWAQIGVDRWTNVWHGGYQNATLAGTLPPPVDGEKPIIYIHQLFSASDGRPDKIVDVEWLPDA
jgi:hypothetical protein